MINPRLIVVAVLTGIATMLSMVSDAADTRSSAIMQGFSPGPSNLLLTEEKVDSPYVFNDGKAAFDAVNKASKDYNSVNLYVSPGIYWLDNPDDPEIRINPRKNGEVPYAVEVACDSLSIIGLAENPADIVFAVNRGQTQGALGNYTMIHFQGRAMRVENLTFGNYCNVDLEYPRDSSRNRAKRRDAIVQAQLGWLDGTDKLFAKNCNFISRLNLCPLMGARRSLYKDCYFECTDDALTGTAVYLGCDFTFYSGKPLYSAPATGAIFLDCDINTLTQGTQYFTKVPGMVTAIDTRFTSTGDVNIEWTRDSSPVRCYQSNTTLNGKPIVIDSSRPELSVILDGKQALYAYKFTGPDGDTFYNIPNLLGGDDGWDPLGYMPAVIEAEKRLGFSLTGLPVALLVKSSSKEAGAVGDELTFEAQEYLWSSQKPLESNNIYTCYGKQSYMWTSGDGIEMAGSGAIVKGTSCNDIPETRNTLVSVASSSGLEGAFNVRISPYLKDAPEFKKQPKLVKSKTGDKVIIDYELTGSGEDDSYIVWYRSVKPDCSDSIAVRHGHGVKARHYSLSPVDNGARISALVIPRYSDSKSGLPSSLAKLRDVVKRVGEECEVSTSFEEIPIRGVADGLSHGKPGYWVFDSYKPADTSGYEWSVDGRPGWYYGSGVDAATGKGLVQSVRGARLSYTPARDRAESMKLSIVAEPAKGPGQGFGSATGQYMDICFMFDPVSLTGYGLRIERTPDYDKAVVFSIVKYDNGVTSPLTEPVPTSCFRTPCNIGIEYSGNQIRVEASTDAPEVGHKDSRIRKDVMISATVDEKSRPSGSSLMIQHTGTTGSGATLLRDLKVSWK